MLMSSEYIGKILFISLHKEWCMVGYIYPICYIVIIIKINLGLQL